MARQVIKKACVKVLILNSLKVFYFAALVFLTAGCDQLERIKDRLFPSQAEQTGWGMVATDGSSPEPGTDSDGDGITDTRERALESNPKNRDTDEDGYTDGYEDRLADFGFDLLKPTIDSDQDGISDDREARLGTNPNSNDTDADGFSDFDEELNRYFGFNPIKRSSDADFDGLTDALENELGSSPTKVDTNDDGITDFQAYSVGLSPVEPKLSGAPRDLIGTTYSLEMADALEAIRDGKRFPDSLALQLPYPDVTTLLVRKSLMPSAALMQRAAYNPHHSPGIYESYAGIEEDLSGLAKFYDGDPGPAIMRLFYWTGDTIEGCDPETSRPGRTIYAVKISQEPYKNLDKPEILFMGVHHARELITAATTMRLLHRLTDNYKTDPDIKSLVDSNEIWVIPVVNPNGYDRAATIQAQLAWRKNTRGVPGQDTGHCGIDLNRNYGFGHLSNYTNSERKALPDAYSNGIDSSTGELDIHSDQYPGPSAFSEVETQAVKGLAEDRFLTETRHEVDGINCSLSWHSFSGIVAHPMSHVPIPPNTGLNPTDVAPYDQLTGEMAAAAGYTDVGDEYKTDKEIDGCTIPSYSVYGDSDDWLYKDKHAFSVLIEAYSSKERGGCAIGSTDYKFYPLDAQTRDLVADNNIKAAMLMLRDCPR